MHVVKGLELVNEPGMYVLHRDGIPYYVGQGDPTNREKAMQFAKFTAGRHCEADEA